MSIDDVIEAASDQRFSDEFVGSLLRANLSAMRTLLETNAQERLLAQGKVPEAMMLEADTKGDERMSDDNLAGWLMRTVGSASTVDGAKRVVEQLVVDATTTKKEQND